MPRLGPLRWLTTVVVGAARRSIRDDVTGVASQFAYNGFLATVPFLFILVSVVGLVAEPQELDRYLEDEDSRIPRPLRQILLTSLRQATDNAGQAALFLFIGVLGGLYVSANVMGALIGGLDRTRGVPHRAWVKGKLVALGFAATAGLLVIATTLSLVGGARLVNAVARALTDHEAPVTAGRVVYPIGIAGLFVFTLLIYRYGPNAFGRGLLSEVPGAIVGVALWSAFSLLFALYVESFDVRRIYGGLGFVAIYLIFLFLSSLALLIGAEVNAQLAAMRAERRGEPVEAPTPVTADTTGTST